MVGHAHARSAIEADKGHQRRRARHVAVGSKSVVWPRRLQCPVCPKADATRTGQDHNSNLYRTPVAETAMACRFMLRSACRQSSFVVEAPMCHSRYPKRIIMAALMSALVAGVQLKAAAEN